MDAKIDKVMVTGSKGFIGTHLMNALGKRGIGFDIKENSSDDITDKRRVNSFVKIVHPSYIIHLAAISNRSDADEDPYQTVKTNILGTLNILEASRKYNIPVLLASSAAVEHEPYSLYGNTKNCVEVLAQLYPLATICRLYNVYGPGSNSVVNVFTYNIKNGISIVLHGNTVRDYIYIDDVVNSFLNTMEQKELRKRLYFGTEEGTYLKTLVEIIERVVRKKAMMVKIDPLKEIQISYCQNGSDVVHKTPLEEGIKKLL